MIKNVNKNCKQMKNDLFIQYNNYEVKIIYS